MKKIVYILGSVLVLSACGTADSSNEEVQISTDIIDKSASATNEGEEASEDQPFFEFVEEVVEFGKITQGEIVSANFKFKNVGTKDLIISSAQGSCGCTVPEWPKEPIKPGAEGTIAVKFNSNGKSGLQNKTITLVANTVPNTKVLAIKGEVIIPDGATPQKAVN